MRIVDNGDRHEIDYVTDRINNCSFDHEGFVQKSYKKFELSETPRPEDPGIIARMTVTSEFVLICATDLCF